MIRGVPSYRRKGHAVLRTSHRVAVVTVALLGALLCPTVSHAVIPGTGNPHVRTDHEWIKQILEFHRRNALEAYKEFGHRDPKWDAQAVAFLEPMCLHAANMFAERWYVLPGETPLEELFKLGQAAVDAGCDDPLVLGLLGSLLIDNERFDLARPLLRRAIDALGGSRYHPIYWFNTIHDLRKRTFEDREADLKHKLDAVQVEAAVAAAATAVKLPKGAIERRLIYNYLASFTYQGGAQVGQMKLVYEAMVAHAECDPWIRDAFGGRYHHEAGAVARGGGFQVTPEGGQVFQAEMAKAYECNARAYELEPDFPEAPGAITYTALSGQVPPGETVRSWFDRTVAASSIIRALIRGCSSPYYHAGVGVTMNCASSGVNALRRVGSTRACRTS